MTYTDSNQIGEVTELNGSATITRADGSVEDIVLGSPIYQGDIIETTGDGAVNIGFIDDSSFAVSQDARIAIDEFVFDPSTDAGAQDFSVTRGVFMYTSGLIGRENPDSVEIETPVGSIGIRGTIIGGNINPDGESTVSVIEGAIVVRNDGGEQLLTNQFDTVTLLNAQTAPSNVQSMTVTDIANKYGAVKDVSTTLFSAFSDQMKQEGASKNLDEKSVSEPVEEKPQEEEKANPDNSEEFILEPEIINNLQNIEATKISLMPLQTDDSRPSPQIIDRLSDARPNNLNSQEPAIQREFIKPQPAIKIISIGTIDEANGANLFNASNLIVGQVALDNVTNVTYSLVNSTIHPQFSINNLGQIIFDGSHNRDFELNQSFNLRVQATNLDTGRSSFTNLNIGLNDVNERANIKIALEDDFNPNSTVDGVIAWGVPGAIIGKIAIMDPEQQAFNQPDFQIIGPAFGQPATNFFEIQEVNNEFFLALRSGFQIIELGGVQRISADGFTAISGTSSITLGTPINFNINLGAESFNYTVSLEVGSVTNVAGNTNFNIVLTQDIVIGDFDNNTMRITDDQFEYINGKDGFDELRLQNTPNVENFDLSNTNSMRADLSSIEKIVFGDGNDTLTMDINTLITLLKTSNSQELGMGEIFISSDASGTDTNGITFKDAAGNIEQLTDMGFNQIADRTVGADTYHQFQHAEFGTVVIETQINGASTGGL